MKKTIFTVLALILLIIDQLLSRTLLLRAYYTFSVWGVVYEITFYLFMGLLIYFISASASETGFSYRILRLLLILCFVAASYIYGEHLSFPGLILLGYFVSDLLSALLHKTEDGASRTRDDRDSVVVKKSGEK